MARPKLTSSTLITRFLKKIEMLPEAPGCWIWMGCLSNAGYGVIKDHDTKILLVHRLSYEHFRGPIPTDLECDHLCRLRCCCNPWHIELVTRAVNVKRGLVPAIVRARHRIITHCPNGHEYSPENTRYVKGCRLCRKCGAIDSARRYQRRKLN